MLMMSVDSSTKVDFIFLVIKSFETAVSSCCNIEKLLKPENRYFGAPCTAAVLFFNRMKTFYRQCKGRDKVSLSQTRREVESCVRLLSNQELHLKGCESGQRAGP